LLLLLALGTKQIDVIMSGMSVSRKRLEVAAFTRPYMQVGQVAIVRLADLDRFTPASEALYVNGLRVGYEVGTTGMGFVVNTMLLAQPVKFQSADAGLKALQAGEVAAFIHDQPTAWRMTSDAAFNDLVVLTDPPLTQEDLAWAVHKDSRALLDALNGTLDTWKKSGYLTSVLDRWMGPPPADQ
jgi:polar amino acid transport system substrate-binding protein